MSKPPPDPLYTMKGQMTSIQCLLFRLSNTFELLYVATQDGMVHIWCLKSCRNVNTISVGKNPCLSIHYLEGLFITQEKCGDIKVWAEEEDVWTLQKTIPLSYVGFCKVVTGKDCMICPEENSVASIRTLGGVVINNIQVDHRNKIGNLMVMNYQVLENKEYIFLMYESGELVIWERQIGKLTQLTVTNDCPMALDFDGASWGIIGTSSHILSEFLFDGSNLTKGRDLSITNAGVSCIKIRPDRLLFVAGCWDGRIRFFSKKTLKLLAVLDQHQGSVHDVIFSNQPVQSWKCKWLCAAGGEDKKITLWNLYNPCIK